MKTCAGVFLTLILGGFGVGFFTWTSDTCTVYMGSHNANMTLQGWGSRATCQSIENSGTNDFFKGVNLLTLGIVDERAHEGTPQGDVICEGWDHYVHYTIRDYGGLLGLNAIGHGLCSSLQSSGG